MQTTRPTSKAGQLRGCTIFGAKTSISTETPIFTISHNMKLTALAPGDTLLIRLLMPRAIKAPGTTTTAAPYSADPNTARSPVISPCEHGHHRTHRGLRRDHPPDRHLGVPFPEGLRLFPGQWRDCWLVVVVPGARSNSSLGHETRQYR